MPARKQNLTLTNTKNMEFKGTKGRWEIIEDYDDAYSQQVFNISNNVNDCMATIWSGLDKGQYLDEETKANALLISKAPEMLEMLQHVIDKLNGNGSPSLQFKIDELIKEATEL